MTDAAGQQCQRTCRIVGALSGLGIGLLLLALAKLPILLAALVAVLTGVALALFLGWAFCTGSAADTPKTDVADPPAPPVPDPSAPPPPVPVTRSVDPLPVSPAAAVGRAPLRTVRKQKSTAAPGRAAVRPVRAAGLDVAVSKSRTAVQPGSAVTLSAPRGGKPDDLKEIAGIGPVLERLLNDAGVWHFDQIASWKAKDIAYFNGKIPGFRGRITRDGWVAQARALVAAKSGDDAGRG